MMQHTLAIAFALLSAGLLGVTLYAMRRVVCTTRELAHSEQRHRDLLRDASESKLLVAAIAEAEARVQAAHQATAKVEAQLEQALLEQNAVLEHTPVSICFVKDRVIVRCNSGFEKL